MIKKGSWVIIQATAPGLKKSYPTARWVEKKDGNYSLVKLLENAPFTNTVDVLYVETVDGFEDAIYDFNILGRVSGYKEWEHWERK